MGFAQLFHFVDRLDCVLIVVGTANAVIHDCSLPVRSSKNKFYIVEQSAFSDLSLPIFLHFFGDLVNSFGRTPAILIPWFHEVVKACPSFSTSSTISTCSSLTTANMEISTTPSSDIDYFASVSFPPVCVSATPTQLKDEAARSFFFLKKNVIPGASLTMQFKRSALTADLLLHCIADAIPFSFAKLPDFLALLSINPNTEEAREMSRTLEQCEQPATTEVTKYCTTSVESIIDFVVLTLATADVQAASTAASEAASPMQPYIVCGFHYNTMGSSVVYEVSMQGSVDRNRVEAMAVVVCHLDMAVWNPKASCVPGARREAEDSCLPFPPLRPCMLYNFQVNFQRLRLYVLTWIIL
ncbi:burp domain-containing protein 6-like [Canna indica]|uniref:Burp domain-containing protein 6-like n=1 Tax=Canna indica TaxID=4628 RepID=A0AAQ3KZH2_9LILI|nr:burp domain-containing protein 6-like [Canna indica]